MTERKLTVDKLVRKKDWTYWLLWLIGGASVTAVLHTAIEPTHWAVSIACGVVGAIAADIWMRSDA